jgi:hypothetical protein
MLKMKIKDVISTDDYVLLKVFLEAWVANTTIDSYHIEEEGAIIRVLFDDGQEEFVARLSGLPACLRESIELIA